jgi:hypothetical protein
MRAIRKGKKETGQSPSRRAEVRPDLFTTTRNSTGAEKTNGQHGFPSRANIIKIKNVASGFSAIPAWNCSFIQYRQPAAPAPRNQRNARVTYRSRL